MTEDSDIPPGGTDEFHGSAEALKRLARKLVTDEASADDVVQDVWVAALKRPPGRVENPRAWMSAVARYVVAARVRRERDRGWVERDWAEGRPWLSMDSSLERESVRQLLVKEVEALGAPYREAIRLRFLEGLSTAEVADRIQAPVSTVKTRLRRGLAQLRQRLHKEYGDGRSLGLGLVFAFDWKADDLPPALLQPAHALEGRRLLRVALPVLGLGMMVGWWAWPEPPVPSDEVALLPDRPSDRGLSDDVPVPGERRAIAATAPPEPVHQDAPPTQSVSVVDPAGLPIAGAELLVGVDSSGSSFEVAGVTDELGRGEIVLEDATRFPISVRNRVLATAVKAEAAGLVDSIVEYVTEPRDEPLVLRVGGPELSIRGRVIDSSGAPMAGFLVHTGDDTGPIHPRGNGTWWSGRRHRTFSAEDGSFRLDGIPPGALEISARRDGTGFQRFQVDGTTPGEIVADLVVPAGATLRGRVVDSRGRPVAGVQVRQDAIIIQDPKAFSDAQGRFELRGLPPGPNRFTAYGGGGTWDDLVWNSQPGEEREHEFQLRKGREVVVRVVDETGAPFARAVVTFTSIRSEIPYARQMLTTSEGVAHMVGVPMERIIAHVQTPDMSTHIAFLEWEAPDGVEETVVYRRHQVATTAVRGVCLQSDGALWRSATVRFTHLDMGSRTVLPLDDETGEFERQFDIGPYLLELIVENGGATRLGEFELVEGEVNDLGILRSRPRARLETEFLFDGDPASYSYEVRSRLNAGDHANIAYGTGAPPSELGVLPGVIRVWIYRDGEKVADRAGRVEPGGTLLLRLGPDLPVDLSLVFDRPPGCPDETARLIVTRFAGDLPGFPSPEAPLDDHLDALVHNEGVEVANISVEGGPDGRFSHRVELSPGRVYNAFLESPDGWVGSVWFPLEGHEFEVRATMRRP